MGRGSVGATGSSLSATVCSVRLAVLLSKLVSSALSAPAILAMKCYTGIGCDVGTRSPRSSWRTRSLVPELEVSLSQSPACSALSDSRPSPLPVRTWASAFEPPVPPEPPPSSTLRWPLPNCYVGPMWAFTASLFRGNIPVVRKPTIMFCVVSALSSPLDTHIASVCFEAPFPLLLTNQASLYLLK